MIILNGYDRLSAFVVKRENVRLARENGLPFPWTDDPVISGNRFCNVRREDDRVTKWVAEHWRNDDAENWFAMVVARMAINRISTMRELGYPVPWDKDRFIQVLQSRANRGEPVYGQAYMIIPPVYQGPKAYGLAENLLDPIWAARETLRPRPNDTLMDFACRLMDMRGVGTFTAGQVVADVKRGALKNASDWWTWATPGPGSRRGLNRVLGVDPAKPRSIHNWLQELAPLREFVNRETKLELCAQDVQNCLCEFDKYERVTNGEGAAKQRYTPGVVRDA